MPSRQVVVGQKVRRQKVERSRELRRVMTPAEKVLWVQLRNNQLNRMRFRRQQIIAGFIVDFYCHAAGVIVNVDGEIHQELQAADAERDAIFAAHGFVSLHITNTDVFRSLDAVLAKIEMTCRQAASPPVELPDPQHAGTPPRAGEGPGVRSAQP